MIAALILASTLSVTSNTSVVKGWVREHLTYDPAAERFSRAEFPSAAEAEGAFLVADSIPQLLDDATQAMYMDLAPLLARLDEQRARPVVTLFSAVDIENAVERQNLTMCVASNEIERVGSNLVVRAWVYGNEVLSSEPVMRARLVTDLGSTVSWHECEWTAYGDESRAVEVERNGGTYETYLLTATIPNAPTNMAIRLRPWVSIGTVRGGFDFGNRQLRVNGQMCCTTNDLSFLGTFYTTNGIPLDGLTPYADRGELRFATEEDN